MTIGLRVRGMTLVELMVAIVVSSLVIGAMFLIYQATYHVWSRCASQAQSVVSAYFVSAQLSREVKNAYAVTIPAAGNSITLSLPRQDASGVNIIPFQLGAQITYYLSDSTGVVGKSGTCLWRQYVDAVHSTTSSADIANNVTSCSFQQDALATGQVLKVYCNMVTVAGQQGAEQYASSFQCSTAMRNVAPQ